MSLSTESILILITTVAVAAIAVGIITGISDDLSERIEFINEEKSEIARSDMKIISDLGSDNLYDDGTNELVLLIRNTGERRLELSRINLFVEDDVKPIDSIEVIQDDSDVWSPEDVIRLNATVNLESGRNSIIVEKFGAKDNIVLYV